MLKKTRNRLKRIFKRRRKTRRLRGGSTKEKQEDSHDVTDEDKRTKDIIQGVVTDVMKELKKEGVLEKQSVVVEKGDSQKQQKPERPDTFSENRPTGMVEQILLAPVRIPAKLVKLPFKLYKAPFKFLKKLVF
jgi:hypothetical protein